ncbi:type II toxin-antitoxin system PemK/MazF family toxin [Methylobacterium sp. J-072]|uniref:type II toxin-antitoxin system PemK/MazF family toxin n=1 Tax=Methylobacterium sp. J-072 TaxID=2836651 RepID=UPI001FB90D24|nr:type II toxin-antitoxin system PemK/MazF family toxin [Methylobacterium sp. J-072]MCJ2094794.1 type II toxin-antitoxin system PemK/MazF family toxin [Methylobacterium sp. J-072]
MPTSDVSDFPAASVVVVPFPYSDRLAEKRRPALVVSGTAVAEAGYVWIAMITSARNAGMAGDIPIAELGAAGLGVASVVRPLKIACIEPNRILRRLGALHPDAAAAVYAAIHGMVGHA